MLRMMDHLTIGQIPHDLNAGQVRNSDVLSRTVLPCGQCQVTLFLKQLSRT